MQVSCDLNMQHRDGYNCYDSTYSDEIKRLLKAGFNLRNFC